MSVAAHFFISQYVPESTSLMRTELEKMLAGELYDASDATLAQMRYGARAR